jgi:uncharacterized membrane protein YjgN (DUF898 family)
MRPNLQSRMPCRLGKLDLNNWNAANDRWGIEATRSEFYRTPLIVAMSVILALMIVAGIIL